MGLPKPTDYRIYEEQGVWVVELQGEELGRVGTAGEAARRLEGEVGRRLPPYWRLRVWNEGEDREDMILQFRFETLDDLYFPSFATMIDHAWGQFLRENPEWGWVRAAKTGFSELKT